MDILYHSAGPFEYYHHSTDQNARRLRIQDHTNQTYDINLQLRAVARKFPYVGQPFAEYLGEDVRNTAPVLHKDAKQTYTISRSIPAYRWSQYRANISQLYMSRTLQEVMQIMKDEHGFDATEQMYKKRFAVWGLRKYSPRTSKQEELQHWQSESLSNDGSSSEDGPETLSPGTSTQNVTPASGDEEGVTNIGDGAGIPHVNPQDSSLLKAQGIDLLLRESRRYYSWFFHRPLTEVEFSYTLAASNVFDNILNGRALLTSNRLQGFALLNKACSNLAILLKHPHFRMVNHLIYHCSDSDLWDNHGDVRLLVVRHIIAMIRQHQGQDHPLFQIASLLLETETYADVKPHFIRLILDVSNETLDPFSRELLSAQLETSTDYIRLQQFDRAEQLVNQVLDRAVACGTDAEDIVCHAKYVLGTVYFRQGRYSDARSQWLKVMASSVATKTNDQDSALYMMSCRRLGEISEERGVFSEAEHFLRLAVDGSLRIWGADDPATMRHLKNLERILFKMGKHEDVARLSQEYSVVLETLKEFQLDKPGSKL